MRKPNIRSMSKMFKHFSPGELVGLTSHRKLYYGILLDAIDELNPEILNLGRDFIGVYIRQHEVYASI